MNRLDISRINALSPYKVWEQEDGFNFETDFGLRYAIDFDDDTNPNLDEILAIFDEETAMFNELKP